MRILIFGGDGMLGHRLMRDLAPRHEVRVTLRRRLSDYASHGMFSAANSFDRIDVRETDPMRRAIGEFRPDAVVNAAGILKTGPGTQDPIAAIEINALFPHRLAAICLEYGARLLHYSTDCVFSGRRGNYTESDVPDPVDLYGRSKLLGEPAGGHCITLRTSMIGFELSRKTGLLEWFLAQKGIAMGYRRAVFSGLTTPEQARIVEHLLTRVPWHSGTFNVSAAPISKFDFLVAVRQRFGVDIDIVPDEKVEIDRSLDSSKLREAFAYQPPSWDAMIDELARIKEGAIK